MDGAAAATAPAVENSHIVPNLPLLAKAKLGAAAFAIQNLVVKPSLFVRDVKAHLNPPENRPDLVKTYPCRPHLPVRIFFPKTYDQTSKDPLPVLFTIHGGGFVIGTSNDNDDWNTTYASRHNSIVIALNYAKAPGNPFPGPVHDCEALFLAALADDSLPLDRARVAIVGWSAGGNLCLAIAQLETVRRHLTAVVPVYPAADLSLDPEDKIPTRRYKPDLGGFRGRDRDYLLALSPVFEWSYKSPGEDTLNPLLSPALAPAEALPKHVFVIGCELDFLAHDGQRLIHRIAGRPPPPPVVGKQETSPKGELVLDDERFHFEVTKDDGSRYRWLLVPDTIHGFDQPLEMTKDADLLEDARIKMQKTLDMIGEWILQAPPIRDS